jgi:hypothetical protein
MTRTAGAALLVSMGVLATIAAAGELPTPTPTVCTQIPPPKLSFQFSADPPQPVVGDDVQLSFTVSGSGGIPQYTLFGAAPVFAGDTSPMHSNFLGPVTYQLTAAQAGTASLTLDVNYETAFGCVESPIFQFVSETSPPFAVEVVEPTPTATPTEPCSSIPCSGACAICPPCTPGTVCAQGPCVLGTCEMVLGGCACVRTVVSPTPTATPTPPPLPIATCIGDCDGNGSVDVSDLITGVNIVLGALPLSACPAFKCLSDCGPGPIAITPVVDVSCLVQAVNNALTGCPAATCASDEACDDGNGCTADRCTANGCVHECVCV